MTDPITSNLPLFFGRFHPLLVHLPIGFLATLAVLECADRIHHFKSAAQARGLVLFLTVLASIVTVTCGLLLSTAGGYDPKLLAWHKYTGIALAVCVILTAISYWTKHHRPYVGLLMLTLLLLGPASHFGGSITHGSDYLTAYAPWLHHASSAPTTRPIDPQKAIVFTDLVQPILAQQCLACHNAEKLKGHLRLDSLAAITKGGGEGPAIVAGDSSTSLLIKRLLLPIDEHKHMPPAGRPQPTDDQLALLQWWIDSGAAPNKTVAELDAPPAISDAIANVLGIVRPPTPKPLPLAEIQPQAATIAQSLHIIIELIAPDSPLLACNCSLKKVFGDHELAQLQPLAQNIVELNLAGTQITDTGLSIIAQMPNLQRLRLERTSITDAGIAHLTNLRNLDYLNLYACPITDASLKSLRGLPNLHHLYLWRTHATTQAIESFTDAKTDKRKIQRWQQEIRALQARITDQQIEVVEGLAPTTSPATQPATTNPSITSAKK